MGGFYSKEPKIKPLLNLLQQEKINLPDLIKDFVVTCCELDTDYYVPVYQYKMALFEYIILYFESYTDFYQLDNWEQKSIRDDLASYVVEKHYPYQVDDNRPAFVLYSDEIYSGIDVIKWPNNSIVKPFNVKTE